MDFDDILQLLKSEILMAIWIFCGVLIIRDFLPLVHKLTLHCVHQVAAAFSAKV